MNQQNISKIEKLVKKVLKYRKFKNKYIIFNTLSKLKLIGKLFEKKRDNYFNKYILVMSELDVKNPKCLDDYDFEVIPL